MEQSYKTRRLKRVTGSSEFQLVMPFIKKTSIRFTLPLATSGCILFLAGCSFFFKSPPPIEQIFSQESDAAYFVQLDEIPIDWNTVVTKLPELKVRLKEILNPKTMAIIENIHIDPRSIASFGAIYTGLDDWINRSDDSTQLNSKWLLALDIKEMIPASILIEKINQNEQFNLRATAAEKTHGFTFITISDPAGSELIEMAVFTGHRSQIRVGDAESLRRSISTSSQASFIRSDMIALECQSFFFANIPEQFNDEIKGLESLLPFDPGILIGGFKSIVMSQTLDSDKLDTTITFEFEDEEQANTAFSYIQLATTYGLKPYLRSTTDGQAKRFVRSIKARNEADLVKLRFSLYQNEMQPIMHLLGDDKHIVLAELFLDLIKKP